MRDPQDSRREWIGLVGEVGCNLLSREGQTELQRVLAKVQPAESRRNDIPKDDVPPDVRRKAGEKYMDLDSRPEWSDMQPVRKLLNQVLKETKK